MNSLDIEITRYMHNSHLAFINSQDAPEAKARFLLTYFKENARKQLSARAYGRLAQELSTRNVKSFSKAFQKVSTVLNNLHIIRYVATTLTPKTRVDTFAAKLCDYGLGYVDVKKAQALGITAQDLLSEYRLGVIGVNQFKTCEGEIEINMTVCFKTPVGEHVFRDTLQAWGFYISSGDIALKKYSQVCLLTNDKDNEQTEMIKLGKWIYDDPSTLCELKAQLQQI